jgi:hypothetical protein
MSTTAEYQSPQVRQSQQMTDPADDWPKIEKPTPRKNEFWVPRGRNRESNRTTPPGIKNGFQKWMTYSTTVSTSHCFDGCQSSVSKDQRPSKTYSYYTRSIRVNSCTCTDSLHTHHHHLINISADRTMTMMMKSLLLLLVLSCSATVEAFAPKAVSKVRNATNKSKSRSRSRLTQLECLVSVNMMCASDSFHQLATTTTATHSTYLTRCVGYNIMLLLFRCIQPFLRSTTCNTTHYYYS